MGSAWVLHALCIEEKRPFHPSNPLQLVHQRQRLPRRELVRQHLLQPRLHRRSRRRRRRRPRRHREERQVVHQRLGLSPALALALLQRLQHHPRPLHHRRRQPGQPRHLHPVGPVRRPFVHLVQEDHLPLPLPHRHRGVPQARQLRRQRRKLMIMRGEQRPAAVDVVQVLQHRPGDRQPVVGRRPPPDLVEDDQRPRPRLVQDRRRLHHLDHEGRPPPRQVVRRPHPAEELVDDPDLRLASPARTTPSAPAPRSARSAAGRSTCPPCSAR